MKYTFDFLELPERALKPRTSGLSMVHDPGLSAQQLGQTIESIEPFLDILKFRSLNPRLYPESSTFEKIEICKQNDIKVMLGGNVGEMAWFQGKWDMLVDYAATNGWDTFEISASYAPLSDSDKMSMIERCQERGLDVVYEWGLKKPAEPLDPEEAAQDIERMLSAGVRFVIVEEGEIDLLIGKDGAGPHGDRLSALLDLLGLDRVMMEATDMKQLAWLLKTFGPDVSIGNLSFDQVMDLEPLRHGIGRLVDFNSYDKYLGDDGPR